MFHCSGHKMKTSISNKSSPPIYAGKWKKYIIRFKSHLSSIKTSFILYVLLQMTWYFFENANYFLLWIWRSLPWPKFMGIYYSGGKLALMHSFVYLLLPMYWVKSSSKLSKDKWTFQFFSYSCLVVQRSWQGWELVGHMNPFQLLTSTHFR